MTVTQNVINESWEQIKEIKTFTRNINDWEEVNELEKKLETLARNIKWLMEEFVDLPY